MSWRIAYFAIAQRLALGVKAAFAGVNGLLAAPFPPAAVAGLAHHPV